MDLQSQVILGINCAHDASACLMIDGQIRVAILEERLSRKKHHEGFPHLAINYCLNVANIHDINNVHCIVMNQYTKSSHEIELLYLGYKNNLVINPSHHLLHAYYAYCASGFINAAVLIVDGSGYNYGEYVVRNSPHIGPAPKFSEMDEALTLFHIDKGNIDLVDKTWGLWNSSEPYYRFPSLGHMFSVASQYIFGDWVHAGKTMGLAPYGDSSGIPFQIITLLDDGIEIDVDWILKLPKPSYNLPADEVKIKRNLAAKVQEELENAILHIVRIAHRKIPSKNLCLSGGVALNSVANGLIVRDGPFEKLFIAPAASDGGIAIGAALYGFCQLNSSLPASFDASDFYGKEYEINEISELVQNDSRIIYELVDEPGVRAASDIAEGKIVGWFEGGSEFGPRALGHRSILCDPRLPNMKDMLNSRVKYREGFRPYAASVLKEHTSEYFAISEENPYMLVVTPVHPEKRSVIPAVCHVDGTCRIQTVDINYKGQFRQLIEHFFRLTSVPLVLNTSFNIRGEPIVETPSEALACFLGSGIDTLYIGPYRISKIALDENFEKDNIHKLIPCLNDKLILIKENLASKGKWMSNRTFIRTRTGYQLPLEEPLLRLLELIDGRKTGKELLYEINNILGTPWTENEMLLNLYHLQKHGLICFIARESTVAIPLSN